MYLFLNGEKVFALEDTNIGPLSKKEFVDNTIVNYNGCWE